MGLPSTIVLKLLSKNSGTSLLLSWGSSVWIFTFVDQYIFAWCRFQKLKQSGYEQTVDSRLFNCDLSSRGFVESVVAMAAWSLASLSTQAAQDTPVEQTLAAFDVHIRKNNVDVTQTPFKLGRKPVIDPETELVLNEVANAFFQREYRKGYELPRV